MNDKGEIQGILANETLSVAHGFGYRKVAERYSGFGGLLSAAKKAVFKETEGDISYDAGVEMDLKLTAALTADRSRRRPDPMPRCNRSPIRAR